MLLLMPCGCLELVEAIVQHELFQNTAINTATTTTTNTTTTAVPAICTTTTTH
jgi:hypothetical protein